MSKSQSIRARALLALSIISLALLGCGTTSEMKTADGQKPTSLEKYNAILVKDFEDKVSAKVKADRQEEVREQVRRASRNFPDMIAAEIRKTRAFEKVLRE